MTPLKASAGVARKGHERPSLLAAQKNYTNNQYLAGVADKKFNDALSKLGTWEQEHKGPTRDENTHGVLKSAFWEAQNELHKANKALEVSKGSFDDEKRSLSLNKSFNSDPALGHQFDCVS